MSDTKTNPIIEKKGVTIPKPAALPKPTDGKTMPKPIIPINPPKHK